MDYISSKNIFLLTRDTLKLIDRRLMKHGTKTGYILYKMLEHEKEFEKFEIAEFVMLASLHDIGAYGTDDLEKFLQFDIKDVHKHSIYGYLFLKHLSPLSENAKMILYHGLDYSQRADFDMPNKKICDYLCLAETVAIHQFVMGTKFDVKILEPYVDKRFSKETYELFMTVCREHHVMERIAADDYDAELDELMDYIMFTNEQKVQAMEMLMYCFTFRSKYKVIDSVTTLCLCKELAAYMQVEEREYRKLFLAAIVHDIGMLAIPAEVMNSREKFTPKEKKIVQKHVEIAEQILKERLDDEITRIAVSHHERLNGSGYPEGQNDKQMNVLQKILQLADTLTAMINGRPYRMPMGKDEILRELKKEKEKGTYSGRMLDYVINEYETLIHKVRIETNQFLHLHNLINNKYHHVCEKYNKMKK